MRAAGRFLRQITAPEPQVSSRRRCQIWRRKSLENVELPLKLTRLKKKERFAHAATALKLVGLGDRLHHKPNEMSGGQRQRVAVARALVTTPSIILADEPTGNLDSKTGDEIMLLFETLSRHGNTIIVVTHEETVARHARRRIHIHDGMIASAVPAPAAEGGRP